MRPFVAPPVFDGLLRIFFRPLDRFFRRVPDLAKDATRLRFGIRHVELILDQLPDAAARPDRVGMAELRRAFFEEAFEFGELFGVEFGVEFGRSTVSWFRREGVDALLVDDFSPKFDGRKVTFENVVDLVIVVALFDQLPTLNPAVLEIRKFALLRAHKR